MPATARAVSGDWVMLFTAVAVLVLAIGAAVLVAWWLWEAR